MISNLCGCRNRSRHFFAGVILTFLSAGALASAERELARLIEETVDLKKNFQVTSIVAVNPNRADATSIVGKRRHAITLFRSSNVTAQIGSKYCHAALSRPERVQWYPLFREAADWDATVADSLAETFSPSVRFRNVEVWALTLPKKEGWQAAVCSVLADDILIGDFVTPTPEEVRVTRYQTGKMLFERGLRADALEQFRQLKGDRALYPDAVLYVIAIVAPEYPDIAQQLRERVVDIQKAVDPEALKVYAEFLLGVGNAVEASRAVDRCLALGGHCE